MGHEPAADLDFLCDDASGGGPGDAAAAVEAVRGELLDWAAAALASRRRDVAVWRGHKGLQRARQDLDLHLKHLHGALVVDDGAELQGYARWVVPALAARGVGREAAADTVAVLQEALLRYVPPPWHHLSTRVLVEGLHALAVASPATHE